MILVELRSYFLISGDSASRTLAGQRVEADDGDAETLAILLGERNLVDLVSFQVRLKRIKNKLVE